MEANIKITGFDDNLEIVFTPSDLKDLPVYDGKVEGADSEGNPVVYQVKGAYLKDLLEKNGKSLSDIEGLRMVATDGYSIDVQKDIIQNRDIILGYEMDVITSYSIHYTKLYESLWRYTALPPWR